MQVALKCADIGHLAAAPDVHRRWALLLEEEFFLQVCNSASVLPSAVKQPVLTQRRGCTRTAGSHGQAAQQLAM